MVSALSSATASAAASRTLVEPRRPQPPATGTKISGALAVRDQRIAGGAANERAATNFIRMVYKSFKRS